MQTRVRLVAVGLLMTCVFAMALVGCPKNDVAPSPDARTLGAVPIPQFQQVANWYIDPANATGCASDSCSGQSATCAGGNQCPLSTWHQLNDAYWGCLGGPNQCPRLRQNTTITWLSSTAGNADPVYFFPAVENGAVIQLVGQLPAGTVGALASVTALNRATPQLLLANSGAAAVGVLVKDTQATHISYAWTYALNSGVIYKMSEPLAPVVIPTQTAPAELNNWANTDTDIVYATGLPAVNLANVQPTLVDPIEAGVTTNAGVYIYHLFDQDPLGAGGASVTNLNAAVWAIESAFQRSLTINGDNIVAQNFFNCYFTGSIQGGPANVAMNIIGGVISTTGAVTLQNGYIDGDTIVNASPLITSSGVHGAAGFGTIEVESGKTLTAAGGGAVSATTSSYNSAQAVQWGAGTLNVASGTRLAYAAGAGKAAATFLGTLNLNGQTKACLSFPANAATTQVCNVSLTAANVDTNLGASNTGCMTGGQAGGALCNGGL